MLHDGRRPECGHRVFATRVTRASEALVVYKTIMTCLFVGLATNQVSMVFTIICINSYLLIFGLSSNWSVQKME